MVSPAVLAAVGETVSSIIAIGSLAWMAWQMIRIWWFPVGDPGDLSTRGLAVWASEFFFLFVPLLMVVFVAERSWGRFVPGLLLVVWCGACGAAVAWTFSGERGFVASYLLAVAIRVGDTLWTRRSWTRRSSRSSDAALDGIMMRWGLGVGLFLLVTFAGFLAPWPAGRTVPAAHGRGLFERHPEMALAAMTLYFAAQAVVATFQLRRRLRAAWR